MAYEPKTWACGDTITADALNHLERGVEEASQGGGDAGYECAEVQAVLTDETVTTIKATESSPSASASLYYSELIDADEITLTLDGTEYALQR